MRAAKNDPNRQRGFSVEGAVTGAKGTQLIETRCDDVALTRKPANTETFATMLKSLSAGSAPALQNQYIDDNEPSRGAKKALTGVNIEDLLWGDCAHNCYDKNKRFRKGAKSAYFHLVKCHGVDEDDALRLVKNLASSGII